MSSIQLPIPQEPQLLPQSKLLKQGLSLLDSLSQNFSNPSKYLSALQDSLSIFPANLHFALSLNSIFLTFLYLFPPSCESFSSIKSHLISVFQSSITQESKYQVHLDQLNASIILSSQSMISTLIGSSLSPNQVFSLLTCTELFSLCTSIPTDLILQLCQSVIGQASSATVENSTPCLYSMICRQTSPYLPEYSRKKFTLVLDLDETLGHYNRKSFLLRPGVHEFIDQVSQHFELVLFTAAQLEYANWAMKMVDPNGKIFLRLYSQHTTGTVVKDLDRLGRDLKRVIIVDNYFQAFCKHKGNGILIKTWLGDENDRELAKLAEWLRSFAEDGGESVEKFVCKINRAVF